VARAILRILLGAYLQIEPVQVAFAYGKQGKPRLGEQHLPDGGPGIRFNVSHSGTLALYGFVQGYEIGVDIERFRDLRDMMSIARRSFAPGEYACLATAAEDRRQALFFSCWTRKEAYIKAVGDGLSLSLDSFEVTMSETDPARIVRIDGETEPDRLWRLVAVPVMPAVAAAVCVQPGNLLLRTFRLDEAACRL
jgi:4'-phosphopantetheinyl transferase